MAGLVAGASARLVESRDSDAEAIIDSLAAVTADTAPAAPPTSTGEIARAIAARRPRLQMIHDIVFHQIFIINNLGSASRARRRTVWMAVGLLDDRPGLALRTAP